MNATFQDQKIEHCYITEASRYPSLQIKTIIPNLVFTINYKKKILALLPMFASLDNTLYNLSYRPYKMEPYFILLTYLVIIKFLMFIHFGAFDGSYSLLCNVILYGYTTIFLFCLGICVSSFGVLQIMVP